MENSRLSRSKLTRGRAPMRSRMRRGGLVLATIPLLVLGACSDDESNSTEIVGEDFPGDTLDATCARLDAGEGDDQEAIAAALLDELIERGGEEPAVNTLRMATVDRCPEWADAVDAAIAARS